MDFENRIKAQFRNDGSQWAVDVGIEAAFPEAGIEDGYMAFSNEEILQCFEPVVKRILELVRQQITAIQAVNRQLQVRYLPSTSAMLELITSRRTSSSSAVSAPPNTSSAKSNSTSPLNSNPASSAPWTPSPPLSKAPSPPV